MSARSIPVRPGSRRCVDPAPARRPCAALKASVSPGGSSAGIGPAGVSTSVQRPRALSCGCCHTSCMSFMRALAICASSSRSITCSAVSAAKASTMIERSACRSAVRREFDAKRSSRRQLGLAQHLLAEGHPLALVLQPEHHGLAVARGERAVRVDRRVRRAGAWRRRARRRRRSTAGSPSTRPCSRASTRRCGSPCRCGRAGSAPPGCWCRRTCPRRCRRSSNRPSPARRASR